MRIPASLALVLSLSSIGCASLSSRRPFSYTEALGSGAKYEPPKVVLGTLLPSYPRYCSAGDIPEYMVFHIEVGERGEPRITEVDPKPDNPCTIDYAREVREEIEGKGKLRGWFFRPAVVNGKNVAWKDTFIASANTF
ncbi:MAG: hypothetical protein HYW25_01205 [Candidatus Aenigmarchaeota archaeon]|nr:hypothetical protein [Candidatus Aenigmarchaeota archaeon]